jgi:hypothetical protein
MSMNTCGRTTPPHSIFQSGISPKVGKNPNNAESATAC